MDNSEIVCMVKCVLNCSFICFDQKAGWNERIVLFYRANQSELSGFQLYGQRNWRVIIVSGNVSAFSRNWWNQIQNSLGRDWQSRWMSARYRVNFGRNQVEGFAISQNIYLDAVFTWFIWYVLLETTPSSESMEIFINCATSSWSVVCLTSYNKFVLYVANSCQLIIGSSLGPSWLNHQSVNNTQETKNASDSLLLCKLACQYHLSPKCLQYFLWSSL